VFLDNLILEGSVFGGVAFIQGGSENSYCAAFFFDSGLMCGGVDSFRKSAHDSYVFLNEYSHEGLCSI